MRRLFIADLHLHDKRPDIIRAFVMLLEQTAPDFDELYLLGDIFEAWVGDDGAPEYLEPVYQALRKLSAQGTRILFQHGNRDFLFGQEAAARLEVTLLPEVVRLESEQGPFLVLHGDQLCTDDQDYQQFRHMVRNPQWQQAFLAKPLAERMAIAQQLRETSRSETAGKAEAITDVSATAVSELMQREQVELIIHGHTHRPALHHRQNGDRGERIVLGDWDREGWYLEMDAQGIRLYAFDLPAGEALQPVLRQQL
ncbi:UDP-2,3-diacylglucosamine diphosphatase [Marinobacterium sp. MBR-109]|jgi:UDP-2,3-diacylglucosamine hydrolase|uniref:UDP-2,3-diacylglucosamine diphosphatase n=1 Tax=Marinobacterium sp. MBR-109 TaxID=3156462 RepID=UPI0033987BE2